MKFTYIILITTYLSIHCFGEEDNGKTVSSSYSYSIEYDDGEHGNFGHKIEVKDGTAKVNIRSDNPRKFNSVRQTKQYLPQTQTVEKPKQEITYVPAAATEHTQNIPAGKNNVQYAPAQAAPAPKNEAYNSALQKYSQEQLSVLLSQNKNPFLPIDPKDSISKFISKYVTPQGNQVQQSYNQAQPSYQYQPQQYSHQSPSVPTESKPQYSAHYSQSTPQHSVAQQAYNQPQVQYVYPTGSHQQHIPQSPQTQNAVQYVQVPQTHHYGSSQIGPAQFSQQNYQPETVKYVQSTGHQSPQLSYSIPKVPSGQSQSYPSLYSEYASSGLQGKSQYTTAPNTGAYQSGTTGSKISSQPVYQKTYASPSGSQYQQYDSSAYKPDLSQLDFSKYQYVPTQSSTPYVTSQPSGHSAQTSGTYGQSQTSHQSVDSSKIFGNLNLAQLFSGAQIFTGGNTQYSQGGTPSHPQYVNTASSSNYKPVVEEPAQTNAQQYQPTAVNFDFSKYQFPGFNFENSNSQNKYTIPNNIQLNQISNVQASDNKYGQYAIDFRQGTNPSGTGQVMVHTNYNLGAQQSHGSAPASDNSNVKYVYVPSYVPSSQGHQKQ